MIKYELRRLSFKAFGNIVGKHHKCYITKWVLYMSINYFQMKLPSIRALHRTLSVLKA